MSLVQVIKNFLENAPMPNSICVFKHSKNPGTNSISLEQDDKSSFEKAMQESLNSVGLPFSKVPTSYIQIKGPSFGHAPSVRIQESLEYIIYHLTRELVDGYRPMIAKNKAKRDPLLKGLLSIRDRSTSSSEEGMETLFQVSKFYYEVVAKNPKENKESFLAVLSAMDAKFNKLNLKHGQEKI